MRCLFCKRNSDDTKSVEHIVPESLGNKSFILPLGYVCDKCNNYFAREVEKPFLNLPEIRMLRFQEAISNKKNKMPTVEGLFNGKFPVKMNRKISHDEVVDEIEITQEVMDIILDGRDKGMRIIVPAFTNEIQFQSNLVISRFLAKMALEAFADRVKNIENSLEELVDNQQFDAIRNHARLGTEKNWPCSIRRIYDYNKVWKYKDGETGQMVHESDFLMIERKRTSELVWADTYFVVALWGMEFAINMAGPEIDGYKNWLKEHNDISPLYYGKNKLE